MLDGGTFSGATLVYSIIWSILGLCLLYDKTNKCFTR